MSPSRLPFAGRLDAAGFLIDTHLLGFAEASRRVASAWVPGTQLLEYGDRWLLVLPEPQSVRAEHAPGLPAQAGPHGLRIIEGGSSTEVSPASLTPVDLCRVVDLDHLVVVVLSPAPTVAPAPAQILRPEPMATPRLRTVAGVGAPDTALARKAAGLVEDGAHGTSSRASDLVRGLLARTPATPMLRRRHARYLEELTESFRKRDWDEALRSAISLGGKGGGLSRRLPKRRSRVLGPAPSPRPSSRSVPYGPTVGEHLRQVYAAAARQLEQEGKHLLAAFVHADLLNIPLAAVELLERHGEFREAAELAEGWRLDPDVAVRLWWRAGNRERAVSVAKARGAFAGAVSRLQKVDAEAAGSLRREWMLERRSAGDHLGAVTAAWPWAPLRDETIPDIAAGIAQGGRVAGVLLAHLLSHTPSDESVRLARDLLRADDSALSSSRSAFIQTLAGLPVADPTSDRELSSLALVALLSGAAAVPTGSFRGICQSLQRRADPLLGADLPPLRPPVSEPSVPLEIDANESGQVSVYDAVAVGENSVLVACGELGARLLTHDGRVRAEWAVPTHRLVVADHGSRVLLVTDRRSRFAIHQIDLPTGRPVELPALEVLPLDTYDGSRPVLVSERGIEWVEHADGRWRLVWRELTEPGQRVYQVAREPNQMTALFTDPGINVWRWELPSIRLRQRGTIEHAEHLAVVASGETLRLHAQSGVAALDWLSPYGHRLTTSTRHVEGECTLLASGSAFALAEARQTELIVTAHGAWQSPELATIRLPAQSSPLFRSWRDFLTVGHTGGRLVVLDAARHTLVADIRLRA